MRGLTRGAMLLALLLLPSVLAAGSPIVLRVDGRDVGIAGLVAIELPGGSARGRVSDSSDTFHGLVHGGEVRVYSWSVARAGYNRSGAAIPMSAPERATYNLSASTFEISLEGKTLTYDALLHPEGRLLVRGESNATGRPYVLLHDESPLGGPQGPVPAAEDIDRRWAPGWTFVGNMTLREGPVHAFPRPAGATIELSGPGFLEIQGATVRFKDADGALRVIKTGVAREVGAPDNGVERWTRLIVETEFDGLRLDTGPVWGAAAPSASLSIDGRAAWENAAGWIEIAGRRHDVASSLALRGNATFVTDADAAPLSRVDYAGRGEASIVRVDGRVVAAASTTALPVAVAAVTLGALAAAAFALIFQGPVARLVVPLYTRLTAADVASHPTRARIRAIVAERPGIHLRELHRLVGGAWGPFSFHVRVLERAGRLRLRRQGPFKAVYDANAPIPGGGARNRTARAIMETIAAEGTALTCAEVGARVGASRQLINYHVARLEAEGLVRVTARNGSRLVDITDRPAGEKRAPQTGTSDTAL